MQPRATVSRKRANSTPACELRHALASWLEMNGVASPPQLLLRSAYASRYGCLGASWYASRPLLTSMFPGYASTLSAETYSSEDDEADGNVLRAGVDAGASVVDVVFGSNGVPPPVYWRVESQRIEALRRTPPPPPRQLQTPPNGARGASPPSGGITPLSLNCTTGSHRKDVKDTATSPQKIESSYDARAICYRQGREAAKQQRELEQAEKSPLLRTAVVVKQAAYVDDSELEKFRQLRIQLKAENERNDELTSRVAQLEAELANARERERVFKDQQALEREKTFKSITAIEAHNRELEMDNHQLREDLRVTDRDLKEVQDRLRHVQSSETDRLHREVVRLTHENDVAKKETDALKERLGSVTAEVSKPLRAEIKALQKDRDDLIRNHAQMERQHEALREQLKKCKERADSVEQTLLLHQRETSALVPMLEHQIAEGIGMMLAVIADNESVARRRLHEQEDFLRGWYLGLHHAERSVSTPHQ